MSADFLDSNVLVYVLDESDRRKSAIAKRIVTESIGGDASISFQVVQETLNVITRKLDVRVSVADARQFLRAYLLRLWKVSPSARLYERALQIQERYGYGFYDALIIAAALEDGCRRLLSEDLQDGQQIDGLTIENPFR